MKVNECTLCGERPAWNSGPDEWLCRKHMSRRLLSHVGEVFREHGKALLRGHSPSAERLRSQLFPRSVLLISALVCGEVPDSDVPDEEFLRASKIASDNWLRLNERRGLFERLRESNRRKKERDHAEASGALVGLLRAPEGWAASRFQVIGAITRYAQLADDLSLPIPKQFLPLYMWHTRMSGYDGSLDRASTDPQVHAQVALAALDSAMDLMAMGSFIDVAPKRSGQRLDDFLVGCPFSAHRDIARWYEGLNSR